MKETREIATFKASEYSIHDTISRYEAFGWEASKIRDNEVVMSRSVESPIYYELVKLQAIYEDLVKRYNSLKAPVKPVSSVATVNSANSGKRKPSCTKPNLNLEADAVRSAEDAEAAIFASQQKSYDERKKMLRTNIDAVLVLGHTAVMLREKLCQNKNSENKK